ncbi:MAG: hypothetical protein Q9217_004099 [Psora testacea]
MATTSLLIVLVEAREIKAVLMPIIVLRPARTIENELAADPDTANRLSKTTGLDIIDTEDITKKAVCFPKDTKVGMVKVKGEFIPFSVVAKDTLKAMGVAGSIVGADFIILDFVNHNWEGAAWGRAEAAAGAAAAATVRGPVGWGVGGAIAALFCQRMRFPWKFADSETKWFPLPGLESEKPWADRTDVPQIIQRKLFGDKNHTGNDKPGDGDGKIATTHSKESPGVAAGKAGVLGKDPKKVCADPTFKLNRAKVTFSNIEGTADKIANRIVPAPNGDVN